MRFLFAAAILIATSAALPATTPAPQKAGQFAIDNCPTAAGRLARRDGAPLTSRKLAELPPAETYAAVYRLDDRGCMVPVKYRDTRR